MTYHSIDLYHMVFKMVYESCTQLEYSRFKYCILVTYKDKLTMLLFNKNECMVCPNF